MEILSLFKLAKEYTPENWLGMLLMYLMLKRDIKKAFSNAKPGMLEELGKIIKTQVEVIKTSIDSQVDKLVEAIKDHNKRIDSLEVSVSDLKKRMQFDANR